MWFWFSLIALICWSGSDLFSKIGCQDADDKYSHLKMVMAVGLVMGLHAAYEIFINGTEINGSILLTYLPVSLLYISSMTIGYIGLRYIELSISSPICNSSGALVAVLALVTGGLGDLVPAQLVATALVCVGVIGLGIVEAREDDDLRAARQEASNHRYAKSVLALALPVIYCLLDALGTFADSRVLETLNEDSANCAYELTFLLAAIVCFIYVVLIKKSKLVPKREGPKYVGAICETAGQFAYIYALADTAHVALAAPMGQVYAVECDADACALVRQNQAKFAASNLTLIAGKAPEALQNLPAPDAVFIGGSKGNMQAIVDAALAANPQTRLCIAAIALETLQQSIAALAAHGLAAQVTQIAVSRSKVAGSLHLMMANNPVFLIVRE
jgi:precorrin-6B methylase 2/uncharacterized membrane protein